MPGNPFLVRAIMAAARAEYVSDVNSVVAPHSSPIASSMQGGVCDVKVESEGLA